MTLIFNVAGGLALFLLAMTMMTDGLKIAGGASLRALLERWTSNRLRGVLTGFSITAFVQSSSAVTVAAIGFVNAGVLTLRQALGVVFGANIGTTVTGWLVSIVGFGFKIETFALPMLALGVAIKMIVSQKRLQGLGSAITGFALFFVGLSFLKDGFGEIASTFGAESFADGSAGLLVAIGVGFLATALTQSSSAAIAIILTAVSQSFIGVSLAAAAIVGANIGTTSTAVFAAIGATANAKRVATGHIAFNLLTGFVALAGLPSLLWLSRVVAEVAGFSVNATMQLALFHTLFNVLGVLLLLPFVGRLASALERQYRSEEEDLSKPQHLDKTVAATPALAIAAIEAELRRLYVLTTSLFEIAISDEGYRPNLFTRRSEAIVQLGRSIDEFATTVRMEPMSKQVSKELPRVLRIGRYLQQAAYLSTETNSLHNATKTLKDKNTAALVEQALSANEKFLKTLDIEVAEPAQIALAFDEMELTYQSAKHALLNAAASRHIDVSQADRFLDNLSHTRRSAKQIQKAQKMLTTENLDLSTEEMHNDPDIN